MKLYFLNEPVAIDVIIYIRAMFFKYYQQIKI